MQEEPDQSIVLSKEAQKTLGIIIFLPQIQEVISILNAQTFAKTCEYAVQFNYEIELWGAANTLIDVY